MEDRLDRVDRFVERHRIDKRMGLRPARNGIIRVGLALVCALALEEAAAVLRGPFTDAHFAVDGVKVGNVQEGTPVSVVLEMCCNLSEGCRNGTVIVEVWREASDCYPDSYGHVACRRQWSWKPKPVDWTFPRSSSLCGEMAV